jgi:hypothetical protein
VWRGESSDLVDGVHVHDTAGPFEVVGVFIEPPDLIRWGGEEAGIGAEGGTKRPAECWVGVEEGLGFILKDIGAVIFFLLEG